VSHSRVVVEPTRLAFLIELAKSGGRSTSEDIRQKIGVRHRATIQRHRRQLRAAGMIEVRGRDVDMTAAGHAALADLGSAIREAVG
jgi:predicted transcriptional regulator